MSFILTQKLSEIEIFSVYVASSCYLSTIFKGVCELEGSKQKNEYFGYVVLLMKKLQCFTSEIFQNDTSESKFKIEISNVFVQKSVNFRNVSWVRIKEWFNNECMLEFVGGNC